MGFECGILYAQQFFFKPLRLGGFPREIMIQEGLTGLEPQNVMVVAFLLTYIPFFMGKSTINGLLYTTYFTSLWKDPPFFNGENPLCLWPAIQ